MGRVVQKGKEEKIFMILINPRLANPTMVQSTPVYGIQYNSMSEVAYKAQCQVVKSSHYKNNTKHNLRLWNGKFQEILG